MADISYTAENPFEDDETSNPFEEEQPSRTMQPTFVPPKVMEPTFVPPTRMEPSFVPPKSKVTTQPSYNTSSKTSDITAESLDRKEAELRRREEELERREQSVTVKEQSIPNSRVKNWPRCRPFLYHDISADMPTPEAISLVRKAYIGWFVTIFCLIYNFATLMAVLIIDKGTGPSFGGFFLALAYIAFCVPVTFLIYRLLYNAARRSKPSLYLIYFIFQFLEILAFLGVFAVGVVGWGGGGFLLMLDSFNHSVAGGVICLICFVFWVALTVWTVVIFFFGRREYKRLGGIASAKKEFGDAALRGAASNPELVAKGMQVAV